MLVPEARWFAQQLRSIPDADLFPLLNLGSQTADFRAREQPWLDKLVFAPLTARGGKVVHTDLQAGDGVDLAGDLSDPAFLDQLRAMQFRTVICSNLLEHVVNRAEIAATAVQVVVPGGYLFVSVPYKFPYHPDPIDTLFRPTPDELAALFPDTTACVKAVVSCGSYTTYLARRVFTDPVTTARRFAAAVGGRFKRRAPVAVGTTTASPGEPSAVRRLLPWLVKDFKTTCLVLRKNA